MAVFPENNLQMSYVAVRLGYGYFSSKTTISQRVRLSTLCTCPRINPYSRKRPGYWKEEGTELVFQKPRGGKYADPRGVRNNQAKTSTEDYVLNDFAGYNPEAITPGVEGGSERVVNISSTQTGTVDFDIIFYLGEVDWFNQETDYNGKNFFGTTYTQLLAVDSKGNVLGTCNRSEMTQQGRNLTALHLQFGIPISTSATSVTTNVRFALGHTNKPYAYFTGDYFSGASTTLEITINRNDQPSWIVQVLGADYQALKESLIGLQPEDAASDTFILTMYNNRGSFLGTSRYVNVEGIFFYVLFPSGRRYEITQLRWAVSGDLEVFDRVKNKVVSTSRLSVTMGFWGHGGEKEGYAFTLTIPETPADNMIYRFNLDTFDPASCVENYD